MNSSMKHLLKHYWRRLLERWNSKIWVSINFVLFKLQGGRLVHPEIDEKMRAYGRKKIKELSTQQGRDYLLSFPSSGNHWVRYILEFFSGMPTHGNVGNSMDIPLYKNWFRGNLSPLRHVRDEGYYLVFKIHQFSNEKWTEDCNSVLLLIRDYRENQVFREGKRQQGKNIRWYLDILSKYERVHARKMHIYYEDLFAVSRGEHPPNFGVLRH